MQRTIRIQRFIPYPIAQVWHALTDSSTLGKWFMPNDFVPVIGYEFTFRKDPQPGWDGITWCKVTALEPMHKIAYTYRGSAGAEKALACADIHSEAAEKVVKGIFTELDTVLTFTLIPQAYGTIITVEHAGFKGFKQILVSLVMGYGWKKKVLARMLPVLDAM